MQERLRKAEHKPDIYGCVKGAEQFSSFFFQQFCFIDKDQLSIKFFLIYFAGC